jgi:CubicO group peptidase (beta-lactamase class C family)
MITKIILLLIVALLTACGRPSSSRSPSLNRSDGRPLGGTPPTIPQSLIPDWQLTSPEAQGIDSALLAGALQKALDDGLQLDSLLVIRNGYLVSEAYFSGNSAGQPHKVFSITKSVISLLIGEAIAQGLLPGVDQSIWETFPNQDIQNWDERKAAITIEHLLTMTAGLAWDESQIAQMTSGRDWAGYILDLPMAADPGTTFNYCSGCTHLLSIILEQAAGKTAEAYARQVLFEPMGIDAWTWVADPQGHSVGGWGLEMRSRDLAKLGLLSLSDGNWNGRSLVPEAWMQTASQPHTLQTDYTEDAYGYLWWTAQPDTSTDYWYEARGLYAQRIIVVPDRKLIVVTTASAQDMQRNIHRMVLEGIVPAILSNEPLPENPSALETWQSLLQSLSGQH